jgi:hypothetical protein
MTEILDLEYLQSFQKEPLVFINQYLEINTWSGMRYIIESVWHNKRTSVRSNHGISKTFTAAVIAVTFLNLFPNSIVITTAPTNRQCYDLLWKEIGALYERFPSLAGNLTKTPLRISVTAEWYMVGFSTEKPFRLEGYHAPHILWVLDEAKGLPQWVYDAAEGSMTGGNSKILEISTTDGADQATPFYIHHHKESKQWKTIHLSAFDSPFVDKKNFKYLETKDFRIDSVDCAELYKFKKPVRGKEWDEKLEEKIQITSEEWIKDKAIIWRKSRADLWRTKVLGELEDVTEHSILPLAWVESAIDADIVLTDNISEYGLDVGRGGDPSVMIKRIDGKVLWVYGWVDDDTMATTGETIRLRDDAGIIKVDMIGVGAGVFDRLSEQGYPVIGIDSRNKPSAEKEKEFLNLRAEMWFFLRDLFLQQYTKGNVLSIPDDEELTEELTAVKYKTHSNGKIKIEEKDEIKKRLGRSPNKADALVYCFADISYWLQV